MENFKIYTYKDLLNCKIEETNLIPKMIFRTSHYKLKDLPKAVLDLYKIEFEENKEYKLFYFDDDDCQDIVNDTNDKDFILAYSMLNAGAYKADIIRYLLMYKYGGVYMDFTMSTLIHLDNIIKENELVLVKDLETSLGGIYNAFICSKKGNTLFINLIKNIIINIKNRVYFDNVWELTGPIALLKEFNKEYNCNKLLEGQFNENIFIYKLIDTSIENNQHYIVDSNENKIIKTRIHNHYNLLYKKNKISYPELFIKKKIYKNRFKGYKDIKNICIEENIDNIPKLIFRTGSFDINDIPDEIINTYEDTLINNIEYQMFYFDDNDRLDFIKENYTERYVSAYKKLIPKAYQADFFRYLVLYKFGGIYMDFSMKPIIPLDDILKSYKNVYVRDRPDTNSIYNAFIGTTKKSDILNICIEKCILNIENNDYGYDPLCVTSPIILGEALLDSMIEGVLINGKIQVGEINKNLYIYSFEYGDDEFFKDPKTNNFVVKNKIDNHYKILYKNNLDILRYNNLWENKIVFKDDIFIDIENKYNKITNKDIPLLIAIHIYNKCKQGYSLDDNFARLINIIELYKLYLKREADEDGLANYFSSIMQIDDIKNAIINSEEYKNIQ